MGAPDPYSDIADPVQQPQSDPYAAVAEPVQPTDQAPPADPNAALGGFTDEQKRAILAYIPKAKDAADLERFSLEVSGGKSRVGNAQAVLDKLKNGATPDAFAWTPPVVDKSMGQPKPPSTVEDIRNAIGDGIIDSIDTFLPGVGDLIRQNQGAGKALTEHAANAVAADYGPEVGGVIDTILHGGNVGANAAHERAIMTGDSTDHPVASIVGELTGAGLTGALGNEAGLADAARGVKVAAGTGAGAAYGSGAAGPGNRAGGVVTGAAIGSATEAAAPLVAKFIAATKSGDTAAAAEAAQAAHDLGIDLPKFVAGSEADAQRASALEQTLAGRKPIADATNRMLDQSETARDTIASGIGTAAEPAAMGDEALTAAVKSNKGRRAAAGRLYDQARSLTDGVSIAPTQTMATVDDLLAQEQAKIGGSKIAPILGDIKNDLQRNGNITVNQARDLRTTSRERLTSEAGSTPSNADRLTNQVMDAVNQDMASGLAGKGNAADIYKQADAAWTQQRGLEDEVLKPFLGKNFDNWGEDVARKINSDAKGNGTRLARFLDALPEDAANNVRASLISHLGAATDGSQNAAGDAFSMDRFLTNWNQIRGARNLVFPKDTVQSLDKLAQIAEAVKAAGRTKNRSNTGNVLSYLAANAPMTLGVGETLLTHDPRGIALGFMFKGLGALRQYRAAKLLASPAFAKKLAATPLNQTGAKAFWSRPWVQAMASKNPAIAAEIRAFQSAFLSAANDNAVTSVAASPDTEQQDQNQ